LKKPYQQDQLDESAKLPEDVMIPAAENEKK
jgi:hypothetical protein